MEPLRRCPPSPGRLPAMPPRVNRVRRDLSPRADRADWLQSEAPPYEPPVLLPAVLARTALTRRRPAWRIPDRWLPAHRAWRPNRRSTTPMYGTLRFVAAGARLALIGSAFAFVSSPSPLPPGPRTIVVAQDGSGDFTTISEAVAVAQDGDTVQVQPGTYAEQVTITRDITLQGDGDDRALVVIAPPADGADLPPGSSRWAGWAARHDQCGLRRVPARYGCHRADLTVLGQPDGSRSSSMEGRPRCTTLWSTSRDRRPRRLSPSSEKDSRWTSVRPPASSGCGMKAGCASIAAPHPTLEGQRAAGHLRGRLGRGLRRRASSATP